MTLIGKIMAACFGVLSLVLCANSVKAKDIEINITAEIVGIGDRFGLLKGQLIVGDIITGSYIYDSATPDSSLEPDYGRYQHTRPPYGISLRVGGFVFQTDPDNVEFMISVQNDYYDGWGPDIYVIESRNNLPLYDNVHVGDIWWQLNDPTGTALSSDALPTTAPVLEDWIDTQIRINGGIPDERGKFIERFDIRASVISVELVPNMVEAIVGIHPDTLNLASKGKWITCHIWLPEEYDVADIDPKTVILQYEQQYVEAQWLWFDEQEQEQVAMAKFNRSEVQDILDIGLVELTITGQLSDGTRFEGTNTIRVIDKGGRK